MPRQLFVLMAIALFFLGTSGVPAYSEEDNGSDRDGYPEKVVPGGTFFN